MIKYESDDANVSMHQQSNHLMNSLNRIVWLFIWRLTKARSKEALLIVNLRRIKIIGKAHQVYRWDEDHDRSRLKWYLEPK